jgi:hypothetical protein
MKQIPLTQGLFALVDDEDYQDIAICNWFAVKGYDTFYAGRWTRVGHKRVCVKMHEQIMKTPKGFMVDHENRNGLDNQKLNMRFSNKSKNMLNSLRSIEAKGVYYDINRKRWKAFLLSPKVYVGTFKTELEATVARNNKMRQLLCE